MIRASGNWVASDREVRDRIAKNVTDLLEMRGMSRRELARKTGDSVAAIARVAAGKHTAGAGMLVRVADALGVNVERLIT